MIVIIGCDDYEEKRILHLQTCKENEKACFETCRSKYPADTIQLQNCQDDCGKKYQECADDFNL